ncbi:MAG TPA: SMP-30/gluconolactonase/LRE family protein [Gaiellaceae bacterium]
MELDTPLIPTEAIEPVWFGLVDHVEDVAVEEDGTVWCGGEDGQIYRGRLDGEPEIVARTPGRTYGFALGPDGSCYCADVTEAGVYRIERGGAVERVSAGTDDRPAVLPNDLAFLPSGELLYSDSGNWGGDDGCIYALAPDGTTRVADTSCAAYPNGLAVSPDGSELAVVESTLPGVSVLSLGADGGLSGRRILVELPGTVPDGLLYDDQGRLLVSCWAPDAILRLEPGGALSVVVHDSLRVVLNQPTNIAFIPGTNRLVAANIGDRYLSVIEYV